MSDHKSICLLIHLSVSLSVHPIIHPSIRSSICPSISLFINLSVRLSVHPTVRLSVCPSIHPAVCSSICPSVCLFLHMSIHPLHIYILPSREYLRGKYHCTIELLFDWFGIVCFANKKQKLSVVIWLIPNQSNRRSMVQ
jgi:hypothetical protein